MADKDNAPVSLFLHCQKIYTKMFEQSYKDSVTHSNGDVESIIVWEGYLVKFVTQDCDLAVPYFTYCTRKLKEMGCIKQLRRGGGKSKSLWQLIIEPSEELFNDVTPPTKENTRNGKIVALTHSVNQLNSRVLVLEEALETFISNLAKEQLDDNDVSTSA